MKEVSEYESVKTLYIKVNEIDSRKVCNEREEEISFGSKIKRMVIMALL